MSMFSWGLIGSGDVVCRKVLPALLECGENVIGAASRHYTSARNLASEFKLQQSYPSVKALLVDESIDAVYIATPVSSHHQIALAAARCGKHLICEKPMALNSTEADEMLRCCHREQVTFAVAYYRRFFPVIQKIKQLLDEQAIGIPIRAEVVCHSPRDLQNQTHWRFDSTIGGGGVMMDIGSHRLDLLVYWFGDVLAARGQLLHQTLLDVEDGCFACVSFENEVQATLSVSWTEPEFCDSVFIEGSTGAILLNNINSGKLIVRTNAGEKCYTMPLSGHPHSAMIRHFRHQLEQKQPLLNSGEQAFQTTKAIEAIYRSINIKP